MMNSIVPYWNFGSVTGKGYPVLRGSDGGRMGGQ
jgi:hypothetical protein